MHGALAARLPPPAAPAHLVPAVTALPPALCWSLVSHLTQPTAVCRLNGVVTCTLAYRTVVPCLPCSSGWKLLWNDEFQGKELNRAKWEPQIGNGCQFDIPGWGNNEK